MLFLETSTLESLVFMKSYDQHLLGTANIVGGVCNIEHSGKDSNKDSENPKFQKFSKIPKIRRKLRSQKCVTRVTSKVT